MSGLGEVVAPLGLLGLAFLIGGAGWIAALFFGMAGGALVHAALDRE